MNSMLLAKFRNFESHFGKHRHIFVPHFCIIHVEQYKNTNTHIKHLQDEKTREKKWTIPTYLLLNCKGLSIDMSLVTC